MRFTVGAPLLGGVVLGCALQLAGHGLAEGQQVVGPVDSACWIQDDPSDLDIRISPFDSATVRLDGEEIKVCYSRPRTVGRPIMGRVVPYGEPWRLGANEATSIRVPVPVEIAGVPLESGSYSLYVIPSREEWQVIVNAEVERWGIPIDDLVREQDIGSGIVPVEPTEEPVELLTFSFRSLAVDAVELVVEWADTRVLIPIRARR